MKVLLLSASHRVASTSAAIAEYLGSRLSARAIAVEHLNLAARGGLRGDFSCVERACTNAGAIVLVSPLYHDAPTSMAMEALRTIARCRAGVPQRAPAAFLAIVHSGYPEPVHCSVALEICRKFASEAGLVWLGGLSRGASTLIDGQPLAKAGRGARPLCRALDLAAEALGTGSPLAPEAVALAAKTPIPRCLYRVGGNLMMWWQGRRRRAVDIHARPFDEADAGA